MTPSIAYVAAGKLHVLDGDAPPREVTSAYAEKVRERAQSIDRRHAWKTEGRGGRFAGAGAWAGADETALVAPVARITGLARSRTAGQILYALDTAMVAGVFSYEVLGDVEKRIYHATDKRLVDLATHPDHEAVACAIRHKNGTSSIALMREDGSEIQIVTDGDTIDLAPRWVADAPRSVVFQSAGVARDAAGVFAGVGPFAIQRLDVEDAKLSSLIEDPKFDYVLPQLANGVLHVIRRPYAGADRSVPIGKVVSDAVLAPFRVGNAVVQYLNFFTARYTGKPLITAKGARSRAADAKRMAELGNLAQANDEARRALEREEQDAGHVPSTWELVRFSERGENEDVIATGVAAFDVMGDTVVFTDGRHISRKRGDEKPERVAADREIERVVFY